MTLRVVFDTGTVLSALFLQSTHLKWLREHWQGGECVPLVSAATVSELTRVLAYPKFRLSLQDRQLLLSEYLPICETVSSSMTCHVLCRDPKDQSFLDLARGGQADVLVSGDLDLLELNGQTEFAIESQQTYAQRFL